MGNPTQGGKGPGKVHVPNMGGKGPPVTAQGNKRGPITSNWSLQKGTNKGISGSKNSGNRGGKR